MKKLFFLIFLVVLIGVMVFFPSPILVESGVIKIENPLRAETFEELISAIINFLFVIAIALAPVTGVIAAYYLVTAGGDPKKIETAKNILFYTFIGVLVVLLARALIAMIKEVLGA